MRAIVLHATFAAHPGWMWEPALLRALPYAKRLQLERRDPESCRASLAGIALLLVGARRLGGRTPRIADIVFPDAGKPMLPAGPYFSISHAGACACCALSNDADLGIDLEIEPVSNIYAPGSDDEPRRKLQRWTALEATLKAAGDGLRHARAVRLATNLATAELNGVQFVLHPLELLPGTVCHVASKSSLQIEVQEVDLATPEMLAALQESFGLAAQRE